LGLTNEAAVVAFGAHRLDVRRKGLAELFAALQQVRVDRPLIALCFGGGQTKLPHSERVQLRTLGALHSAAELVRAYSAADLFVIPSLQEAFGQTGLEALACETPVVGFRAGGIPDFVRHEETGLLANAGDAVDLARQIQRLLDQPDHSVRLGQRGRQLVLREFSPQRSAQQHADLYRSLLPAAGSKRVSDAA
jgi:glycosyltransferase involved in cell wall biosynthesis